MEEGDYSESFEISESESDNEIDIEFFVDNLVENNTRQSEYTDTDSSDDSDVIVQKKRKVCVIESDTDDIGSYSEEIDKDGDNWQDITESDEVPAGRIDFTVAPNVVGPQVSSSVVEPLQFFKLFFTDELVDEIIKETNSYAQKKKIEFENNNQKLYVANVERCGTR